VVGHLVGLAREFQHRRPEQGVEVDDVLADEVDLLAFGEGLFEIQTLAGAVVLERCQIADRRVEPDVQVFLFRDVGDADAEIRRIARDVPVGEGLLLTFRAGALQPFLGLVDHLGLQPAGGLQPILDEAAALRIGQLEEEVLRGLEQRLRARQRRVRVLQLGRGVNRAAILAGIAVLVLRAAVRAFALEVAVGEEHGLHRVEKLLDRLAVDQSRGLQPAEDILRKLGVFGRVRRVPVVMADVEPVQIRPARLLDRVDEFLRRLPGFPGREHDRRAVRIVGAHEMHLVPLQALEAHPDIGLDVFHDVADVERTVCVRQRGGDKERSGIYPASHEGPRF
jgi:hypothetical protein